MSTIRRAAPGFTLVELVMFIVVLGVAVGGVLLAYDYAARDATGSAALDPGFKRVDVFRGGVMEGTKACGLA